MKNYLRLPFRLAQNASIALCILVAMVLTSSVSSAAEIKLEAETANRNGVAEASTLPGFSGTGYVQGFDNSFAKNVAFTVNAPTTGIYDLAIRFGTPSGEKGYVLEVNGQRSEGMFPNGAGFRTVQAGKFYLNAGTNNLVIGGGWGYYLIDYITLTPATIPLPAKPPKTLSDANATASTKNLFSYLVDIYGTKVLAAQQETNALNEINFVKTISGKDPAIGGFDLIEYSPSRIANGSNPNQFSEKAIQWAKKEDGRGIINLMWHWNAPTDLINQAPDKLWWSGFYTRATTFDLAAALADKNGPKYQLLLRDMDVIAEELKKFQAQDIPVLWRPLHEAAGAWFWWGAKGPNPFKELWQIMHDRYTNHHQLHNLIWVYTAERGKDEWYPGDAFVDIVGIDIYENTPTASNLSGAWTELQTQFGGKKLVTLSETGNLPNPEFIRTFGTWWSWFSVWNGDDFIRKQPSTLISAVFNDPDVITRDELPDWRNYATLTASPLNQEKAQLEVFPNPSASGEILQIRFESASAVAATATLFSLSGFPIINVVQQLRAGQNILELPLPAVAAGIYLLKVQKGKEQIIRKVVVQQ